MTSILAFDKNHNFQFKGFCKIFINSLSSTLLIEPKNEEFKPIYASFKWHFIMRKNFMFIFADHDFMDLCLVFKKEKICQKVFGCVSKQEEETIQESDIEDMITNRFLLPIFKKINANPSDHAKVIKLIAEWINSFDEEKKERFIKLMEEHHVLGPISAAIKKHTVPKTTPPKLQTLPSRKRKIEELWQRSHTLTLPKLSSYTKCFYCPQIQLGYIGQKCGARPKLLIFTSSEFTTFHLFTYISHRKVYACQTCKWKKTAVTDVDENGNIFAKLTTTEHSCVPQTVIPENFIRSKIIKKPDYEIQEFGRNKSGKTLIIFDSSDRNRCYEYCGLKSMFYCRGCYSTRKTGQRRKAVAKLYHSDTEKEYVEIVSDNHICKIREYQPEKYNNVHQFVLKPNFEIQQFIKKGCEKKTLIVFNENDRSLCYNYYHDGGQDCFVCFQCTKAGKHVTAKLCQNSEGEKYVLLSTNQHICKLKPYVPFEGELTLCSPQIELMKETKNGLPKLFVFVENDRKKCYVFTSFRNTLSTQKYFCTGCRVKIDSRKSERNEFKDMVHGYLVNDENGSYCFKLPAQKKHICSPTDYQPDEFQIVPKSYDFFFFQLKKSRATPQLAVYHPDDKKLAYHFRFNKSKMLFICKKCEEKKNYTMMTMQMDDTGKVYFYHILKKHICEPQKVSFLLGSNVKKLKDDEISYPEYVKTPQKQKKEEKNTIRFPNFELQPNQSGEPEKKLIIFCQNNKEQCYEYFYCSTSRTFKCCQCFKRRKNVFAKLCMDENDEKFLTLGKKEHVCELVKYQPPCRILKPSEFIIFNKTDETKPTKIIVFTSTTKEFCYEYSFHKSLQKYECTGCNNMGKKFVAKILENENGEECLELANSQHICKPRKYEPEKFVSNLIPESMFKLCKNRDKENQKLYLFTSETKDIAFVYYSSKEDFYRCNKCCRLGKTVSAKLCEKENGEKYLNHNKNQHVCDPEKVDLNELDTVIVKESMFEFYHSKTGEKDRRIIVFTSEKKEFIYVYYWCQKNSYRCNKCKKRNKLVLAKFIENENGESYLELNGVKHVCTPERFKRENFIYKKREKIEDSMFELTENINGKKNKRLIIFSSEEDKEMGYIFTWTKGNTFRCNKCFEMTRNILAKLHFDENGKPSIFYDLKAHICEPRICKDKIVPESMFKFSDCKNNKDLIVFATEKKDKMYEYVFSGRNYYKCRACLKQKITVSANLEENEAGKKYLKLNHVQHICKPKAF